MITEHNYTELMKNCMKWNTRTMGDRKKRLRYPYYDQQTGSGQRESHTYLRTIDQRYSSTDASTLLEFAVPERWRKRKNQPPSDAIETKMFLRENPVLEAAISQATHQANVHGSSGFSNFVAGWTNTQRIAESTPEVSNDSFTPNTRSTPKMTLRDDFRDELLLDDDASPDEGGSDEDEWTSKKSKAKRSAAAKANHHHHHHHGGSGGGGGSSHKKKASGGGASGGGGVAGSHATGSSSSTGMGRPARESAHDAAAAAAAAASTADEKRHVCAKCGAKYKSLAGLSYHLAYMHDQPSAHPHQKLLSPNIQISDYCDLCLGSAYLNKNTKRPEDLVTCHDCGRSGHPSCLSFNKNVTVIINRYGWQCIECKSCTICGTSENDDKLLFCDDCDRGYHLYCLQPPLENAPDDEYSCRLCQGEFGASASAPAKRTHF